MNSSKIIRLIISTIFILLIMLIFAAYCKLRIKTPVKTEEFIMSTVVTQTIYGENAQKAANAVNDRLKSLEKLLSLYIKGSDIDNINKNAGITPVKIDDYTYTLLEKSVEYSKLSNGLFDITVAPLSILWGIDTDSPHVPTADEISAVLPLVDYKNLILNEKDKTAFLKKSGMMIDLGGIAKGYFMEDVFSIYEDEDVIGAVCSIGGNIFSYKQKPDNSPFVLGIRNPLSKNPNDIMGKLSSINQSVATTGAYERFFNKDGVEYHHIFDLKTGFPVNSDLLSVTVVSEDGGLTDFLSTTLFLAGTENIDKYLNSDKFSVIAIDKNKNVFCSDNLKDNFTLIAF